MRRWCRLEKPLSVFNVDAAAAVEAAAAVAMLSHSFYVKFLSLLSSLFFLSLPLFSIKSLSLFVLHSRFRACVWTYKLYVACVVEIK